MISPGDLAGIHHAVRRSRSTTEDGGQLDNDMDKGPIILRDRDVFQQRQDFLQISKALQIPKRCQCFSKIDGDAKNALHSRRRSPIMPIAPMDHFPRRREAR